MDTITYKQERVPADCLGLVLTIAAEARTPGIHAHCGHVFPTHYDITLEGTSVKTILAVQRAVAQHHAANIHEAQMHRERLAAIDSPDQDLDLDQQP